MQSETWSVFDSLVDIDRIVQGGNFLRKLPLGILPSVKSRIENAVGQGSRESQLAALHPATSRALRPGLTSCCRSLKMTQGSVSTFAVRERVERFVGV
jgi:hypothetical protein